MSKHRLRVGILATHPVQYYTPWYRELAKIVNLEVFFAHRQSPEDQAAAGYGVRFDWDLPLLDGYKSRFLENVAFRPDVNRFWGCITPSVRQAIGREQFDAFIVHGWATVSYVQAITSCWWTGVPVLVRGDSTLQMTRSAWRQAIKGPIYRWFIPRFDGYLVVGTRAKEYVLAYGADGDRCFDAPHSVDNDFFSQRSELHRRDRSAARAKFDLPADTPAFLFAGRFIDRKEPLAFIRAVKMATAAAPNICGLMVGDGPLKDEARALAASLHAPIRFSGFLNQTEMPLAYAACDALVVPSRWETWGLVVNEAMACGVPAIVTAGVACAGDLVVPGVTGEVVPVHDPDALADRIARLGRDTDYRSALARNAQRHVANFTPRAAAEGTVRAIESVCERRVRSRPRPPALDAMSDSLR
jgi:glycosyltransferase involved in cell wall biosynthesis